MSTEFHQVPLRVVFYQEGDVWIAHCLEFDLAGDGDSRQEAIMQLESAIVIQIEESVRLNNPRNLFSPADSLA